MKLKTPHRVLIIIGSIVLLNVIFPPSTVPRKFRFQEGEIAPFNVIAPYDFYIPKSEDELAEDRLDIARRIPPTFELDNTVYRVASKKINGLIATIDSLNRLKIDRDSVIYVIKKMYALDYNIILYLLKNNYRSILEKIDNLLAELYSTGIVDTKSSEFRIITIMSGEKEVLESLDQLYSVAEAESIAGRNQRNEFRGLVRTFLEPNIIFSRGRTEERIDEVFASVPKTKGKVLKGEIIVEKHKRITREIMEKTVALEQTHISIGIWQILNTIIFRSILYLSVFLILYRYAVITRTAILEPKKLYFVSSLSLLYLVIGRLTFETNTMYLMPVAFFIFLFALYFNFHTAVFFNIILAGTIALIFNSMSAFVYFFIGGVVAAFSIQTINSRLSLYRPMLYVTLSNVIAIFFIDIYLQKGSITIIHLLAGILSGILASVSVGLVLPLFEKLFDFTTDLTLLELGNLNLPIFKEMAMEAAGSYHHSIVVGNLAEAGASAIGADPILARVGAYYHDIGKLKKPEYFIENQLGLKNPHDNLKPQMSALVIISHVKEGVEMAKKIKLPKKLIDVIEQHHGTTTIETFYRKALNVSVDTDQDSFRYPGPKPQSKESALVMLADSVEATARSEKNITVSKMQKIVKENIEKKFNDGQLDDCPLTRHDLQQIKTVFLPILTGVFHPRLDYEQSSGKPSP